MTTIGPRYSADEHTRRGLDLYERLVRYQVQADNHGRIVAIDVESGAFEVANDTLTASRQLLHRHADAQIWCIRIGFPAVHGFGFRATPVQE